MMSLLLMYAIITSNTYPIQFERIDSPDDDIFHVSKEGIAMDIIYSNALGSSVVGMDLSNPIQIFQEGFIVGPSNQLHEVLG